MLGAVRCYFCGRMTAGEVVELEVVVETQAGPVAHREHRPVAGCSGGCRRPGPFLLTEIWRS